MRLGIGAMVGALAALWAGSAAAQNWGAVAYGPGGAWAWAADYPTRRAAERSAYQRCGGRCNRVLTFANSCGAYVSGYDAYGWGNAGTREEAIALAMNECRVRTGNCQLRVWACTTR